MRADTLKCGHTTHTHTHTHTPMLLPRTRELDHHTALNNGEICKLDHVAETTGHVFIFSPFGCSARLLSPDEHSHTGQSEYTLLNSTNFLFRHLVRSVGDEQRRCDHDVVRCLRDDRFVAELLRRMSSAAGRERLAGPKGRPSSSQLI